MWICHDSNRLPNAFSMSKILRCAGAEDTVTLRAWDNPESVCFIFESPNKDKLAEYEMKLINMDQEHLGIPVSFTGVKSNGTILGSSIA